MLNQNPRTPISVNRSKLSVPFRSQLCIRFVNGRCYHGENCHFAHSVGDLRKPGLAANVATDRDLIEDNSNSNSNRNVVSEMKECHYFASGKHCPYGDGCHFLHKCDGKENGDEGLNREGLAITVANGSKNRGGGEECRSLNGNVRLKTRLCHKWEEFGRCSYGLKCIYAHGKAELITPGCLAELEHSNASKSRYLGTKSANQLKVKGKGLFTNWSIEKVGRIYADWLDTEHDLSFAAS